MRARRLLILLAVSLGLGAGASGAFGYWSGFDTALHGSGAGGAAAVNQGAAPTAAAQGSYVVLSWGGSTLTSGEAVDGYIVKRYEAGTDAPQPVLSGCTGMIAAATCTETGIPAGQWKYTVTPVFADNWRGEESELSGVAQTGSTVLELDRTVIGPPLPTDIGGTLSGFAANEGITYKLDGVLLSGSPSSVGPGGTATITSLTIPAGISDGPHTIAVNGALSHAEASILVDTTPLTINAFTTPEANAAGWNNTSPVEVNGTVDDGNGSGIAYVKYTDDGSDPKTSPTAQFALAPLSATETTTYKFFGVDQAGNESLVETLLVRIDTTLPYFNVDLVDPQGAYITASPSFGVPGVAYYRGAESGSLKFRVTPVPLGGSPNVSAGFTPLLADAVGFSFDSSSITTPNGGPYVSNTLSWVAGSTATAFGTISLLDAAGNTFGDAGGLYNDSTAPSGGSVDASGLVGTGGRYSTSLELSLNLAKGTDAAAGLADGTAPIDIPSRLLRASAPLTSSDGISAGSCGSYGAFTPVGGDDPAAAVSDTVPTEATCYRYRYLVADHVGNIAAYESPDIKVKTSAAAVLRPTDATIDPVSGTNAQSVSGSTVFYNPALLGSFNVDSSASAPVVGVANMTFPAIAGFAGGGAQTTPTGGTTFRTTYSWSANGSNPSPGVQSIAATSNAGNTSSNATAFSVVKDDLPPSGGSVDATGLSGTGNRYSTSTTLSLGFAAGSDAGSGLAAGGRTLLRASASLTSNGTSNGICGGFGSYTQVAADPASPRSDTVPVDRTCYRYQYVVSDKVGNQATYTSPEIKVQAAAPPAPALSFSNLNNASSTGNTVFYRPAATSGGFTVTASSADTTSGTTGYSFPTLPAGWSGDAVGPGVQRYSWSAPNPTVPSGALTVTTTNNAGRQSSSSFTASVTSDSTPPSGGTISYPNGYSTSGFVNITFTKGTDSGSGLASASGLLQRSSATLSNGICGNFGAFTTIATNPSSSYLSSATTDCYQYRYLISDNVGNQAIYTSASVAKVDREFPSGSTLDLVESTSAATAFGGASLYYKGDAPGSFKFVLGVLDAASGPASATFPEIATAGWTHDAETVSTPGGGPYTSSTYSWTANPTNPGLQQLVARDAAGLTKNKTVGFVSDVAPPGFGGITYANGVVNATSVPISLNIGNDPGSGVNPDTTIVRRDVAPLTTATETCGAFAGTFATTVTLVGGADTGVTSGNCYRYEYIVSDKVGNKTTYASASVAKVDTSGPVVTAIVSQQSGGATGDGKLQVGDKLILTFNQSLASATVPTSFSGAAETSPGPFIPVTLTIPGITAGAVDTGSLFYVPSSSTATFAGTAALSNNGPATTVALTVTSLGGAAPSAGSGVLAFAPATTILDGGGHSAAGTFNTGSAFKLF